MYIGGLHTHANSQEQSNQVGWSLVKRIQESEPGLISVKLLIFHFYFACAKWNTIGQKVVKLGNLISYQSIMFDEEWLDPHGVGNLPQFFNCHQHMGSEKRLSACMTDVLTMKLPVYSVFFLQTKEVARNSRSMLMNHDVLQCHTADWIGKSKILQTHVIESREQNNTKVLA